MKISLNEQTNFNGIGMKLGSKSKLALASDAIVPLISLTPINSSAQDKFEKETLIEQPVQKADSAAGPVVFALISAALTYILAGKRQH